MHGLGFQSLSDTRFHTRGQGRLTEDSVRRHTCRRVRIPHETSKGEIDSRDKYILCLASFITG